MCGIETALLSGLAAAGRILGSSVDMSTFNATTGTQQTLFNAEETA
jgi:hypothetical protein